MILGGDVAGRLIFFVCLFVWAVGGKEREGERTRGWGGGGGKRQTGRQRQGERK